MAIQLPNSLGPWQPKITRIKNLWLQPCDNNLFIWVAAYIVASPVIIEAIVTPDCMDYTVDRFRLGAKRRRKGVIDAVATADPVTPGSSGAGTWLFKILAATQKIGWYFTLADATLDWFIYGTSLAYRWEGCNDPNAAFATLSMTHKVPLLMPAQSALIGTWDVDNAHIFTADGYGISTPKTDAASAGFVIKQIRGEWDPLPDCDWQATLVDLAHSGSFDWIDPVIEPNGNRSITFHMPQTATIGESHRFAVAVRKSFGVFYVDGQFNAAGSYLGGFAKSACGHSL